MGAYVLRRLLLILPTLLGILLVAFVLIQFAPGGPIEKVIADIQGTADTGSSRASGGGSDFAGGGGDGAYRGAQGLDPELIAELEKQFGFDKPAWQRFLIMVGDYLTFDFGESFFKGRPVIELIGERLPVSISLGLWTMLISYLISIPLGIRKAVKDGSGFDAWTSGVIVVGYAVPGFIFAVMLIVMFAGGQYFDWFPLRGLVSDNWDELSFFGKIGDYFWHLALPLTAMVISQFAVLTMLTKNSFLDEIGKQYVLTARAKGLTERKVLYGHVFRNAMLIVIAGFPAAFVTALLTGTFLIEVIFSLNGLGQLGFDAVFARDYPIVFATLYIYSLIGLAMNLITDLVYVAVDPRIDFESRAT